MPKIADIEFTPNPNAKRFVLKEALTHGLARSYERAEQAVDDPLARDLFAIAHVTNVYYVDRYLTVTQDGQATWSELERALAVPIRAADAATVQAPIGAPVGIEVIVAEADKGRLVAINALLDERVRPALMMDGGGLQVMALVGNRLSVHYQGACGSCPSSISGTLAAIQSLLQAEVDEGLVVTAG